MALYFGENLDNKGGLQKIRIDEEKLSENEKNQIQEMADEKVLMSTSEMLGDSKGTIPRTETVDVNDEVKTQEVLGLRDAYIIQGYEGADALQKAVDLLMPTSIDPAPINAPDSVQQQVAQKKQVANTKNKLKAAEKQPPALKGKNKVEKKFDVSTMSVDEFDALPSETLSRMRGDFG